MAYPVTGKHYGTTWATPVTGNTTFNSLYSGSFVELTGTPKSAGGAGLTATNVAGYDFKLLASSGAVDCGIGIETFTGQTALVYGYTNNGATDLTAFEITSNDGKIFDLQSVDITIDGLSAGTARNVRLVGYYQGSPVTGALLVQMITQASSGGLLLTFNTSANSAFTGIDKFRIETNGSYTISGAIGVDNINATNFRSLSTLPVSLIGFDAAHLQNNAVQLTWRTAEEMTNNYFAIERSTDGNTYTSIGRVEGKGSYSGLTDYRFTDNAPVTGLNYYRLSQVDVDGKIRYLNIRKISIRANKSMEVYPNPVTGNDFFIDMGQNFSGRSTYTIIDAMGKVIHNGNITQRVMHIEVPHFTPGMYVVMPANSKPIIIKKR